jgi:hypothetical protein
MCHNLHGANNGKVGRRRAQKRCHRNNHHAKLPALFGMPFDVSWVVACTEYIWYEMKHFIHDRFGCVRGFCLAFLWSGLSVCHDGAGFSSISFRFYRFVHVRTNIILLGLYKPFYALHWELLNLFTFVWFSLFYPLKDHWMVANFSWEWWSWKTVSSWTRSLQ